VTKTYKQFVRENRIRIQNKWVDQNPNNPDWKDAYHYKTVLRRGNKQLTIYFSTGYGWSSEPEAQDVLSCLVSDSYGLDQPFEDWASDLGYDPDSRKAEKIFNTCKKQTEKLKRFLGEKLFEEIRNDVEPL
jgi:hypothetical protein